MYFYAVQADCGGTIGIVGWEVHDTESGGSAAHLLQRTVISESCVCQPLVLHSDMQPLTIDDAAHMLTILCSSLTEVLTAKLIADLDSGIADILKRHYVVWE